MIHTYQGRRVFFADGKEFSLNAELDIHIALIEEAVQSDEALQLRLHIDGIAGRVSLTYSTQEDINGILLTFDASKRIGTSSLRRFNPAYLKDEIVFAYLSKDCASLGISDEGTPGKSQYMR